MIANYGYEDASGIYYISIDTDKCAKCAARACLCACPADLFVAELDDWDDEIVAIRKEQTRRLKSCCADCKSADAENSGLPCQGACPCGAIKHTW